MLELTGLSKNYNGIPVVNNVEFKISPGEIVGYLGPNGAGKSTTIKMIVGLVEPGSGEIFYNGKSVLKDMASFKPKLGYIPEHGHVYSYLSGLEYLQLIGRLRGMPEKKMNEKIESLLDLLGMYTEMHCLISTYSKGMTQKILLCSALLHDPEIFIFDEMLSGLDASTISVFKHILRMLSEEKKIILFSTHMIEIAEGICDRVIVINRGKIVADDRVDNLKSLLKSSSLGAVFSELTRKDDELGIARKIVGIMRG